MKLATAKEMREIDREAIEDYHIPSILLMEHAAYQVFLAIKERYGEGGEDICIVCGGGNNGGDGLALARQIFQFTEHAVKVILLTDSSNLKGDSKTYYKMCKECGISLVELEKFDIIQFTTLLKQYTVLIDAILGTGLQREITGNLRETILAFNASNAYKISIDMPSGIAADTGKVLGVAIRADLTVTFELPKTGLYLYPGVDYVGELKVVPIGIPPTILEEIPITNFHITQEFVMQRLPKRYTRSNKGTYGKVLIIGGKEGLSGAITLSASSCIRVGSGLVTAAVPGCIHSIMEGKLTEVMTIPFPSIEGGFSKEAILPLKEILNNYTGIAFGPGIGRGAAIVPLLEVVLDTELPCVIDADGLYALKHLLPQLKHRKGKTIITPHPGEFSYLTELPIDTILEDTIGSTKAFAIENQVVTVLKTEKTVIGTPTGEIYVNTTGNSALSKGGSGDVLTGMITGLLAQNVTAKDAAIAGVYLHGKAADILTTKRSIYTILPSELYEGLEIALKEMENAIVKRR